MEIARPQLSEKPPIPAKPRLRPAPPRPPKPPISASLSTVSPTSSSTQINNDKSHSKKSNTLQNGLPKTLNSSAEKPKHAISARAASAETLSLSSANVSSRPPDRPLFQPSEQRKGNMAPSSSLSLPASFRKKNFNKSDVNTPLSLTTLVPSTSSSLIPPSFSQRSPISHVTPSRTVPSVASPKPNNSFTAQSSKSAASEIVHNTRQLKSDEEKLSNKGVQSQHNIPEKHFQAEDESPHLETQKNTKPSSSVAPLRKHSAPPPQRPTSPPSRSAHCTERPQHVPSKTTSQRAYTKPENSLVQAGEKEVSTTDAVCPIERKMSAPPPLPKNPPRGGVPRKPRQSSFSLTSTSETKHSLSQQTPGETEVADDNISGNTNTQSGVTSDDVTQQSTLHFTSQLLVQDDQSNDTKLLNDIISSDASHSNIEARLQTIESNITDNHVNKSKTKTPPKPRPRTRPSLCPNDDGGISQQLSSVDINESGEKYLNQNSMVEAGADVSSEKTPELGFAGICQGDTLKSSDINTNNVDSEVNISQTSDQSSLKIHQPAKNTISNHSPCSEQADTNAGQTDENIDVSSAILISQLSPPHTDVNSTSQSVQNIEEINPVSTVGEPSSLVNFNESVSDNSAINLSGISEDSKSLFQEEPESTCGMLKEIEELLKNKLGNIELDLENRSTKYSQIKSHPTGDLEHNSTDESGTSSENYICSLNSGDSPATSPVRPPRPKRQASIVKHIGSLESLNTSSTECLVSSGLSENAENGKKLIPAKPKRSFLSRVSRSHSDVTGMKSILDSNSCPEEAEQPLQEEVRPFLPPRLESLKRSESLAVTSQSPPPLPPRNKPQSASLEKIVGAESEPPPLPSRSSLSEQSFNCKTEPEVADNLEQPSSITIQQSGSPSVQCQSKVQPPVKLRPSRKAPPPPPSSPRRSATFSPGDSKQPNAGLSTDQAGNMETMQAPASPTVKRSSSTCHHQRQSSEVDDHCYHEISDTIKIREDSQDNEETSPPGLPPRTCKADSEGDQASFVSDLPEQKPVKLYGNKHLAANSQSEIPESPKMNNLEAEVKSSSPKQLEKMVKSALIQKVAQGLGFRKSVKMSKVPEITLVINESKKVASDDSAEGKKVSTSSTATVDLPTDTKDSDKANSIAVGNAEELIQKTLPTTDTSGSAVTFFERPLSEISQQSTSSEQDGSGQNMEEIVSSGTDTEPEEDKEEIYAVRKAKKVFFIANEIVSSENTFVDVLRLLNIDFRHHISTSTENLGHTVIPSETLNKILDFLPQLQNFNEDLLKDLQTRIENWEENPRLADIFVKKGPFLKLYSSYIRNFESATAMLEDVVKKNSVFASILKEFELSPRCAKLALKHYMLKPIQRIPQYKLLLQAVNSGRMSCMLKRVVLLLSLVTGLLHSPDVNSGRKSYYLKQLAVGSLDYKDTVNALNIVSEVADHANDSMRHGDNVQKLLEIQRSIIGQFEVIQPGRVLLKQGELQKLSRKEMQPRMFILFNDVLLYTTPATSGYKINNILPLTGMKIISPKLEDYKFEFNIISVQRSFTLSGGGKSFHFGNKAFLKEQMTAVIHSTGGNNCHSTSEEKDQWVTALQTAIDENSKKCHTFQTVKQGPQTSLLDKDFVLGHKAPLWVPDARVTMCMLCLLEFTLTWRRHHCRSCGRVVCSHCSENKAPLKYLKYEPARVCDRCFEKLREDMTIEYQQNQGTRKRPIWSQSEEDSFTSVSESTEDSTDAFEGEDVVSEPVKHDSGLSLNHLMSRFQKIRISNREKRKPNNFRPSVLKEVSANDEGSDISGYLRAYRSRKWKRLWFVVKGKVLYTYKASEDMAATESMPLLGYEVTRLNTMFEGAEPDLLFELTHQNNQPLTSRKDGGKVSPRIVPGIEKTTQRLIFRTDSATATIKWVTVLREASLTYQ